jgi:hypothetical protein
MHNADSVRVQSMTPLSWRYTLAMRLATIEQVWQPDEEQSTASLALRPSEQAARSAIQQ